MDCERSNINVLVVDHDKWYLALLANILMAWQYKVQTAEDAHQALVILRDSQSTIDVIIIDLYILGMIGFDFQKFIQDQFQIPIIIIFEDKWPSLISKSLEIGPTHFISKPFGAEDFKDFKDIWKYAIEAKRKKIESLLVRSEELQETEHPKKKKKKKEYQGEGGFEVAKKSKFVWTTYLHNLFLLAIKQIGLDKAVPKKILEIMNVPNLTRANVASHLQKYRIFLRNVAEERIVEGVSQRNNTEFPYVKNGLAFQDCDQVRLGKSRLETSDFMDNNGASTSFSSYDVGQGLMASSFSSSSLLTRDFEFGETSYQNYGSIGNDPFNHINHGVKNWSSSSILPQNVSCDTRNNNPFGIQINNESEIVRIGTMNNERFNSVDISDDIVNSNNSWFNAGDQNANMNFRPFVNENFGLVRGEFGFGFGSGSDVRGGSGSKFQTSLVNNEGNVFENRDFPLHKLDGNDMEFDNGATSMNEIESNQMEFNISNYLMADDMNLLNEVGKL
ncbi:unnamed protein product [Trifolium pratense]|uniref:Uncharacterized protein n=1 Tax=Trifolium pratense TaxID=57577 RepID=A0ACB0LAZ4_TRIPR|nr:unnamed protein product [Trifolium pratense]